MNESNNGGGVSIDALSSNFNPYETLNEKTPKNLNNLS